MLSLLTFTAAVQQFAASARAATTAALDFTVGSLFRALGEGHAAVVVWLQWLVVEAVRMSRLATSIGTEVDSWVGDFGVTRLPAVGSTGALTFARFATGLSALVPVGATARSLDGTQSFVVVADLTNSAFSATLAGYVLNPTDVSVTVAATSINGGLASNVQPNTVTVITTALSGIDTVNNALAFSGGQDAESDAALRARFALFITGIREATEAAIGYAITSVQQSLSYSIAENVDTTGAYKPGNFVVTIDDGSGAPSVALQTSVYTAIDAVRPIGSTFSVHGPTVETVAVSMTITAAPGYSKLALQGPLATALTNYINTLGIGAPLLYGQLYRVAYDAVPGVGTVLGLTVNGAQADIAALPSQVVKVGTIAVN